MMMLLIQLLALTAIWLIFLVGPIWLLGLRLCRLSARWDEGQKIQKYYVIASPALARLLIPRYIGYNRRINTNLPFLYDRCLVNRHPTRLSALGLLDYCVTALLGLWYGVNITGYFWLGRFDEPALPVTFVLLMIHALVFTILINWNNSRVRWDKYEVLTKAERKEREQAPGCSGK